MFQPPRQRRPLCSIQVVQIKPANAYCPAASRACPCQKVHLLTAICYIYNTTTAPFKMQGEIR